MPKTQQQAFGHASNKKPYHAKNHVEKGDTLIYALGGLGEVGKNMYCYEHENEICIVDCGVLFPGDELLGVDYVIPDYHHLIRMNKKRKFLVITHGHEDHIGGIPFLLKQVQIDAIYAPRFAKALILKKLSEHKGLEKTKIIEIDENSSISTKYFKVGFFNTIHSIPDSLGVHITCPNGSIVHTGDFKFDLTPVGTNADYQKMAFIGVTKPDLLMSDSTNSGVEDFSISERKVANEIQDIMRKTKQRLIVATFASNVHRVAQIIEAATKFGRKVIVFGRSMENVVDIGRKMGTIKVKNSDFLSPEELAYTPDDKVCIICTGSQGEPLAALSRIANGTHRFIHLKPGDTIVFSSNPIPGNQSSVNRVIDNLFRSGATVLTKSILNNLHTTGHASKEEQKLMLQLVRPTYFMPIHGEYKMLMQHRQTAMETGIPKENIFVCANGDILILRDHKVLQSDWRYQGDDIYVDGNDISGLSTAVLKDRRILADNGLVAVILAIDSKENKILMRPVIVYVDGNDISGLSTAVLKDRRILADNGLVAVILAIDSKENKILMRPVIVSRGFVFIKDSQGLIKEAEYIVNNSLQEKMKEKTTFSEIKNCVRSTLEPFLYKKTHRNPIVIPVILNSKQTMEELQKNRKNNFHARKPRATKAS